MNSSQSFSNTRSEIIKPYGGKLENLILSTDQVEKIRKSTFKKLECSDRNACDIELLAVGAFSPLQGFMKRADYKSVVETNRTATGILFGLPIIMDTDKDDLVIGERVLLQYKNQEIE